MAALGLNMKGKAEKKKAPAKPKRKKAAKKVIAKPRPAVAKELEEKEVIAKTATTPAKAKSEKKAQDVEASKVTAQKASSKKAKASPSKTKKETTLKLRNASFIVEPSKRKKIRKTKVIMEGDLNINNVDAFIHQIKPLFDDYDFIDFSIREASSLDLSHLQMLYYFQNHFVKKGKTVTVDADLTPEFRKIIINNGFKEFMFIPKLV